MNKPAILSIIKPVQNHYHQLIRSCKGQLLVHLTVKLNILFEKIEPTFINFAEKANSNKIQTEFFDALVLIKSSREQMEHDFRDAVIKGFENFSKGQHISYPTSRIEGEDMEVVDNEDLEKHLAIQNMISKTRADCHQQLYALRQRLAVTRGGEQLEERDIPTCPEHITAALETATDGLELNKQHTLIIYLLFDKLVMREMGEIYDSFNDLLVEAGIFPNLKLSPKTPPLQRTSGNHPAASGGQTGRQGPSGAPSAQGATSNAPNQGSPQASTDPLGDEIFESIRSLMTLRRANNPEYRNHPAIVSEGDAGVSSNSTALISAISSLQSSADLSLLPSDEDDQDMPLGIELDTDLIRRARETLVTERVRLYETLKKERIKTVDLDTIELVGMLFEKVLDEQTLPNIAKTLISRLHTPYLKAAILDHHSLVDTNHISRRLLNLLVDAGKNWIDEEDLRRGIYYPIQESIHLILTTFNDDFDVFENQHNIITNLINQLEARAKVVEERNHEAARGREKLESARGRVHQVIADCCRGQTPHQVVQHFLFHAWLDRMILMVLRNSAAEQGDEWTEALETINQVLQANRAVDNPEDLAWLSQNLPMLKKRIEEAIASLGEYHQPDVTALFNLFDSYLQTAPSPGKRRQATQRPVAAARKQPAKVKKSPAVTLSTEEQEIIDHLSKVEFGTWFQLQDDKGIQRRLKLSWFSPVTSKYMFVDRFGIQALIIPINNLMHQIESGKANIMEDPELPFFDRAMLSINTMLKKAFST